MAEAPAAESRSTSLSLVRRLQAKEPDAWSHLVRIYGPLVYRWCRRAGLSPHDAEDIAQNVFQAVAGRVSDFRRDQPGQSFRGWLYGITRYKMLDHFRMRQKHPAPPGGTDFLQQMTLIVDNQQETDSFDVEGDELAEDDRRRVLHATLDSIRSEFTPKNWEAFWLTVMEQRPACEVARELEMPAASVRQARFRVLRRLRRELAEDGLLSTSKDG